MKTKYLDLVEDVDKKTFIKKLHDTINNFERVGLNVEVQYSATTKLSVINYTALILTKD